MAAAGGDAGVFHAAPGHDDGVLRQVGGAEDFIPAEHAAAVAAEDLGAEVGEVVLNLAFAGEAVLLHEGLGGGAGLPLVAGDFIAADVDVGGAGEEFADFCQDVADELEGEVAGCHDVGEDAPSGFDSGCEAGAVLVAEPGVGCYGGAGVAGDFDFGDDGDAEAVGVGDDVADVVLGVVEVNGSGVFDALVEPVGAFGTAGAHGGEAGVFFDFDAPALVVAEVPVEAVEFVARHEGEDAPGILHADGVAAGVEHDAAVLQGRVIAELHAGQGRLAGGILQDGLGQGLGGGGQGGRAGYAEFDACGGDADAVGFAVGGGDEFHAEVAAHFFRLYGEASGHEGADGGATEFAAAGGEVYLDSVAEQEAGCIRGLLELPGLGDDGGALVNRGRGCSAGGAQHQQQAGETAEETGRECAHGEAGMRNGEGRRRISC